MTKNIRKAKKEDISRIAEIEIFNYRLNFYPIFKNDEYYFDELQVLTESEKYYNDEKFIQNTYVYDDGAVKGFISVDGKEIKKLFVEPVLQGQSIGAELLNYALKNHNVNFLWALEKNQRAIKFYEKNGFHKTDDRKFEEDTTEYLIKMEKSVNINYIIREINETEYDLLNDFLYEAIFIPEGIEPPDKSIIQNAELQVYVDNFGKSDDDKCLVAEVDGEVIGAVWVRIMNDYGHIDDKTPSFAISLYKEYRGFGIGTDMMIKMLEMLKKCGYEKASLAVQKANYAVKMYLKTGFKIIDENDEEYIMVTYLK